MRVPVLLACLSLLGCAVDGAIDAPSSTSPDEELDQVGQPVQYTQFTKKTQFDGSVCQNANCGPTSAAMFRLAMTGGSENYSGGKMRSYYQQYHGLGSSNCNSCSGCGAGTRIALMAQLLEHIHEYDGGPNLASATTYYSSLSLATVKDKLNPTNGYVGYFEGGGPGLPCDFEGNHNVFVLRYNPSTDKFLVFDPECSASTAPNGQWILASTFDKWRNSNGILGKGVQKACIAGTTDTCATGDPGCPCSPCGHATRTCTSSQTWGAWGACSNGC